MTNLRSTVGLLPVLHVLLEECSVGRTAKRLNLTQSAVSQALARAREAWADALLVRQGQRMLPTPLAVELAKKLDRWMAETQALLSPAKFDPSLSEATITLTANDFSEAALLPRVLGVLSERAPGITVLLRSIEAYPLDSVDFSEGRIHFALAGTPPPPGPFETQLMFNERFVLLARLGHPQVGPDLTMDGYLKLHHVLVSPQGQGATGLIDDHLARLGVSRRVAVSLTRFSNLPHLLAAADFVAAVPSRFAATAEVRRTCQVLELPFPSPTWAMSLIWHRRYRNDPLHQWLRGLLLEQLSDGAAPR